MCNFKSKNFRLLEVAIPNINQRDFYFPLDEQLRDAKRIVALTTYMVGDCAKGPFSGSATVNDTVFNKSMLTLQTKDGEEVQINLPLKDISKQSNAGLVYEVELPPLNITKCRITVPENTSLSTSEVFLIGFHYEK